jgi:hypothetical protein
VEVPRMSAPEVQDGKGETLVIERVESGRTPERAEGERHGFPSAHD